MAFRRRQLFEFNDLAAVPAPVRDTIVESLGRTLAWGHVLAGLVEPLEACLAEAGCREVLDLGSGSGLPAALLADEFKRRGHAPPRFHLTDLHPRPAEWDALAATRGDTLAFEPAPVDATAVPPELSRGRVRTVINVLHHLPPDLARDILVDACTHGEGVFVAEGFGRHPFGFATMWPTGLPALLLNPLLTRRDRAAKVALTWLTPAALTIGLWDGVVSTLRIHTPEELAAMVAPLGDRVTVRTGEFRYLGLGRGFYFACLPRRPSPA